MAMDVLIVDDSTAIRKILQRVLHQSEMAFGKIHEAGDGVEALNVLRENTVHLVFADVNMPNMDGLTMAEKIRSELGNASVNIIMLTTENSPIMKERGKAAGIKGWIVKPFKGDAVLPTFKKLVGA